MCRLVISYVLQEFKENNWRIENQSDYYRAVASSNRYPTDDILEFFNGSNAMYSYVKFAVGKDSEIDTPLKVLGTDRQKAAYLTSRILPKLKEYTVFKDISLKYGHLFQTEWQKELVGETNARLFDIRGGAKAMNFTLPDIADKMISLTDFVGNIVVVDLWATWCGPCKAEVPHWKTLIEQFKGNIVSVDAPRPSERYLKEMIDARLK